MLRGRLRDFCRGQVHSHAFESGVSRGPFAAIYLVRDGNGGLCRPVAPRRLPGPDQRVCGIAQSAGCSRPCPRRRRRRSAVAIKLRSLPPPRHDLLNGASLFLDLDGTLLDIADRPDSVRADRGLLRLLDRLNARLDNRLAIVSGRSLEQIDEILGEAAAGLAVSGSHGCEHRARGVWARPIRPPTLDQAVQHMRAFAEGWQAVVVEEKSFGVALHYRLDPSAEAASVMLAENLAHTLGLRLQRGKMMVELRVPGGDKGRAVHRLMSKMPMLGTIPVFVGDDVTDEPGFLAARELGGHGIMIGTLRSTAADYRLASPAELRAWLAETVQ